MPLTTQLAGWPHPGPESRVGIATVVVTATGAGTRPARRLAAATKSCASGPDSAASRGATEVSSKESSTSRLLSAFLSSASAAPVHRVVLHHLSCTPAMEACPSPSPRPEMACIASSDAPCSRREGGVSVKKGGQHLSVATKRGEPARECRKEGTAWKPTHRRLASSCLDRGAVGNWSAAGSG